MAKILIITNIPAPYRVLQFNKLSKIFNDDICVIYYQKTELNRHWEIPILNHKSIFLRQGILSIVNFYPDIFRCLRQEKPEVIIGCGFTITIMVSFIYTRLKKSKFLLLTDTWIHPVRNLRFYHKIIRSIIIPKVDGSICVGMKGKEFLIKYGAKEKTIFISPLAILNDIYATCYVPVSAKEFDLIYSGQFIKRKMPFFIIDVLKELKKTKDNVSILIIGSGPLKQKMIDLLIQNNIRFSYPGFIQQTDLPRYYSKAKILLFPTKNDPWGLVANEACAVGLPVITCENAGIARDLIIHNYNGYILPLTIEIWVNYISKLLIDLELYNFLSKNSLEHIKLYSVDKAVDGIKSAIFYALGSEKTQ